MIQTEAENPSQKINGTDTRYEYPAHNCPEAGLEELYALFEAEEYQQVLSAAAKMGEDHPHLGEVAYVIGLTHTRLGDPKQALVAYTIAQKSKFDTPYVQHNIAEAFRLLQHPKEAVQHYQKAIELLPDFPEAKLGWALAQRDQGKTDETESTLRLLIRDHPDSIDASFHLANLLRLKGQLPEAVEAYYLCLDHSPRFADAWNNLGLTLEELHRESESFDCFRQALSVNSESKESRQNLARLLMHKKRHREALRHHEVLVQLESITEHDRAVALQGMMTCLLELGEYTKAVGLANTRQDRRIQLLVRLQALPVIYESEDQLEWIREQWNKDLDELDQLLQDLTEKDPEWPTLYAMAWTISHFYLPYQMKDDRREYEQYCDILNKIVYPRLKPFMQSKQKRERTPKEPIRIGIISPHLYNHNGSIWALGWFQTMAADPKYQIFTYNLSDISDFGTEKFKEISTYRQLSIKAEDHLQGLQQIVDDDLDFLLFTDIGMHPISRILSILRLAPVQAQGWGHPVTSGSKEIDIYFSGDGMETEESENFYSEKLWRLPRTGLNYPVPTASEDTSDKLFKKYGLAKDRIIINSLQSTFKYIPNYDWIFAEIIARTPDVQLVMVNHMGSAEVIKQLKARMRPYFERYKLDIDYNVRILPRLEHNDYMSIFKISHLTLDTIGWNGGNSSFQSFAQGCPVITLPTTYMRGRHTRSMLQLMEIHELIAKNESDYIEKTHRLLTDEEHYLSIKNKVIERSHHLFNDQSVAVAFQKAVQTLCKQSK